MRSNIAEARVNVFMGMRQKIKEVMKTESGLVIIVFAILAIIPLFVSGYPIYIIPQYIMYGLLAMSLALIWGFGGILSFGQAALFAVGGYALGIWLGADYAISDVVNPFYIGILLAFMIPGLLAFVTAYFIFSGGVRGAYFVILTLAMAIIIEQLAINEAELTGGWSGLFVSRPDLSIPGMGAMSLTGDYSFYYVALPFAILIYILARWLVYSKIGKVLKSIRENEDRTLSLGYNTALYKSIVFGLSGALAGVAGAGYAAHSSFIDPKLASVLFSTEVILWVAIAGRHSLLAAFLGGLIVPYLTDYASTVAPVYWQLGLAIIFVIVVVFSKGGIAELISRSVASLTTKSAPRRQDGV